MIRVQTLERARGGMRALDKPTFVGHVTDLVSSPEVPEGQALPRPQSFLVEQTAHWTLPTHFHVQDQFQLFVAGAGTLGRHAVGPGCVHYASAHSGYGPLVSGAQGISYLTLRLVSDTGAWYLPEQIGHLRRDTHKRQKHAEPPFPIDAQALRTLAACSVDALMPCDASGLAVWLLRLPPRTRMAPPVAAAQGSGRFYVVLQGALRLQTDTLSGLATVFVPPEDSIDLESGSEGAELMVLQFPADSLLPVDARDRRTMN